MSSASISQYPIVLDACIIINLATTGELENILTALPVQCIVSETVIRHEALSCIDPDGQEVPINLTDLIARKLLLLTAIDTTSDAEAGLFVTLAAQNLGAGETESAAIAISRQYALAIDDRRAINVITALSPTTQIVTTPELIKAWADGVGAAPAQITQVIKSIRKYQPPKTHSLLAWWQQHLS